MSLGLCSGFSFGLFDPARLLLLLLSLITETESVAWTRLEIEGMLCACDVLPLVVPLVRGVSFGELGWPDDCGVLIWEAT
jgi:hypothetical protein